MCWAVFGQAPHENQSKTKHEESIVIACLDEGSTPSGSTKVKPSTFSGLRVFIFAIFTNMEILFNPLFITLGSCGVIFIVMGYFMSKKPPKEINGLYGYRTPRAMKNQKIWEYAQVYSAKVMMKYGGYFLLLCLPGYFMDIAPEIATGAGLIVLLIGVAFMIFQVETHLKKWESDSSKRTNKLENKA